MKLDGNSLDPAVLGTGVPVDPGKHAIDAKAKGKKPFSTTVDVSDRVRTPSVEIPALEAEPEAAAPVNPPGGDKTPEESNTGSTQRIAGIAVMAGGVIGVGIGVVFGLRTSSTWSDAKSHCTGTECDRTGVQLAADAKNAGTVSTITFIAGGALLAGGAALYFTAPSGPPKKESAQALPKPRDVRVGVGAGSVLLSGRF